MAVVNQKSDRIFQVWEYQVSHGQLLIRSPKTPASEKTPGYSTNVDLVFLGVDYMAIPRVFNGFELVSPTSEEVQYLKDLLEKEIDTQNIAILVSDQRRFAVVAASFSISENNWDIFDSPFELRSHYRCKK